MVCELALEAPDSFCERAVDRCDRLERLVHEHEQQVGGQHAGHTDTLALSAAELGGDERGPISISPIRLDSSETRAAIR